MRVGCFPGPLCGVSRHRSRVHVAFHFGGRLGSDRGCGDQALDRAPRRFVGHVGFDRRLDPCTFTIGHARYARILDYGCRWRGVCGQSIVRNVTRTEHAVEAERQESEDRHTEKKVQRNSCSTRLRLPVIHAHSQHATEMPQKLFRNISRCGSERRNVMGSHEERAASLRFRCAFQTSAARSSAEPMRCSGIFVPGV